MCVSKLMLVGTVGAEPRYRDDENFTVVRFPMAVTEKWGSGDSQRHTDWEEDSLFGKRARFIAEYVQKRDVVCVVGSLRSRLYKNSDGEPRVSLDVRATDVELTKPKEKSQADFPADPF